MSRISRVFLLILSLITLSFHSCKKDDGMDSETARKIQYRWERISSSTNRTYSDGTYTTPWTVRPIKPGSYIQYDSDAFFYKIDSSSSRRFQYKVDRDKILYLDPGYNRATTPQYTDTTFIKYVDDHLLVLYKRSYFLSPAYSYINEFVDSLKR